MLTDKKIIGRRIKSIRRAEGINQNQLANLVGISKSSMSEWETGKREPRLDTIRKIANALGVDVREIVDIDSNQNSFTEVNPMDDRDINLRIGQQIRALRTDRKLSQEELCDVLGIARSTIAEWERGKNSPSISSLIRLADTFEVSIHDLIDGIAAQPSGSTTERAITLAELFRVLDAKHAAIVLTISPAVKARIDLDFANTDQIEDVTREYGDCPISLFQLRSINDNGFAVIVIDHKPRTD